MVADRTSWLRERRLAEERTDALFAPGYDERWGRVDPTHRSMLDEFLSLCPTGGSILDAACGTEKYWPKILGSGHLLVRADPSRRMLSNALAKFPEVRVEKVGLQDLRHEDGFDGVICVDAMENLPPEDWPVVLRNFHGALRETGHLYLTVETAPEEDVEAAFLAGRGVGLPLVRGEWAHGGGYHFYPGLAPSGSGPRERRSRSSRRRRAMDTITSFSAKSRRLRGPLPRPSPEFPREWPFGA